VRTLHDWFPGPKLLPDASEIQPPVQAIGTWSGVPAPDQVFPKSEKWCKETKL